MLRQLNSHQLAEMYAFYRIERMPITEADKARQRAEKLRAIFTRASHANEAPNP